MFEYEGPAAGLVRALREVKRHVRRRDKISVAALVVSGVALIAVIVTPVRSEPSKGSGRSSERLLMASSAEERAAHEDRAELGLLDKRVEALRKRLTDAEASRAPDPGDVIRTAVGRELARRWKEFDQRLKAIRRRRR